MNTFKAALCSNWSSAIETKLYEIIPIWVFRPPLQSQTTVNWASVVGLESYLPCLILLRRLKQKGFSSRLIDFNPGEAICIHSLPLLTEAAAAAAAAALIRLLLTSWYTSHSCLWTAYSHYKWTTRQCCASRPYIDNSRVSFKRVIEKTPRSRENALSRFWSDDFDPWLNLIVKVREQSSSSLLIKHPHPDR